MLKWKCKLCGEIVETTAYRHLIDKHPGTAQHMDYVQDFFVPAKDNRSKDDAKP